jgi:hypothetical protein
LAHGGESKATRTTETRLHTRLHSSNAGGSNRRWRNLFDIRFRIRLRIRLGSRIVNINKPKGDLISGILTHKNDLCVLDITTSYRFHTVSCRAYNSSKVHNARVHNNSGVHNGSGVHNDSRVYDSNRVINHFFILKA